MFWKVSTKTCGIWPFTSIKCNPLTEIRVLTRAARDNLYLDVACGRVDKCCILLNTFVSGCCFQMCVSGVGVLICLYASAALYALFRYLGFPVWNWWHSGVFPPTPALPWLTEELLTDKLWERDRDTLHWLHLARLTHLTGDSSSAGQISALL